MRCYFIRPSPLTGPCTEHWMGVSRDSSLAVRILTSAAYRWGSKGHEIVADMAETQFIDTTGKRIKELLPQGTTLAEASTWPTKLVLRYPIWMRTIS